MPGELERRTATTSSWWWKVDVTAAEAGRLFAQWPEEFAAEKELVERVHSMPAVPRKVEPSPLARDLDDAMRRLAL